MSDSTLEGLWKHVLDDWENDAAHHLFLDHCQQHDQLVEAAVRYRGMKGDRERGPSAERRLAAVLMLAMSKLEVTRTEPKAASGIVSRALLILLFLIGSLLVLAYLMKT